MQKAPPTPKGFRDIKPEVAKKRREVINRIIEVLESEEFGFLPIETPTLEFAQTLKGKYGEEERLIYEFKDRGGRDLALRYDLTVPLARYVATYNPPLPFRRYQIGVINPQMKINDRQNFAGLGKEIIIALDKLEKIGESAVVSELIQKGLSENKAAELLTSIRNKKPTDDLEKIFKHLEILGVDKKEYAFDPYLARGLDYYTGAIFELRVPSYGNLSIGSGGRYDNLIGMLSKKQIPAVGFSFGLDRLIEALGEN